MELFLLSWLWDQFYLNWQIGHGIETDRNSEQYVSFGDMSVACMTRIDPCIPTGGSFAFWIYLLDCPDFGGVYTSYPGEDGSSGVVIRRENDYYA